MLHSLIQLVNKCGCCRLIRNLSSSFSVPLYSHSIQIINPINIKCKTLPINLVNHCKCKLPWEATSPSRVHLHHMCITLRGKCHERSMFFFLYIYKNHSFYKNFSCSSEFRSLQLKLTVEVMSDQKYFCFLKDLYLLFKKPLMNAAHKL